MQVISRRFARASLILSALQDARVKNIIEVAAGILLFVHAVRCQGVKVDLIGLLSEVPAVARSSSFFSRALVAA